MTSLNRHALLIATGSYQDASLRPLHSPAEDARALADVLKDPKIGNFDVTVLVDRPAHTIRRELQTFFRDRNRKDILLVHISGHGVKEYGRLFFAATDSEKPLWEATAVDSEFLMRQMEYCRSKSIVVLLDCCYSGAIRLGVKAALDDQVGEALASVGSGHAVITASSSSEYAWEEERVSVFTHAVVTGLASGEADIDKDGIVTVDDLYEYVKSRVADSAKHQTPQLHIRAGNGSISLAESNVDEFQREIWETLRENEDRSGRFPHLSKSVAQAITADLPRVRAIGLKQVFESWLAASTQEARLEAEQVLRECHQTDDSNMVRQAAGELLERGTQHFSFESARIQKTMANPFNLVSPKLLRTEEELTALRTKIAAGETLTNPELKSYEELMEKQNQLFLFAQNVFTLESEKIKGWAQGLGRI